jgi:hypothetical protein
MRITTKSNIEEVSAKIDQFAELVSTIVAARAANKLSDQAQTAGFRKVAEVYDVGPRVMEKYATERTATPGVPSAAIIVKGKGFPLSAFNPRQTRQGVSVRIKGRRVLIRHAFIATMPSGHRGVFARGKYGAHFQFGAGTRHVKRHGKSTELPIAELFSFAPADAFSNPAVVAAMDDRVTEQGPKVFAQELRFATR